jgi:hypothetical protein
MDTTIVFAQVLGVVFTVCGLAAVVDRKGVGAAVEQMTQNRGFMWFFGFVVLVLGAVIVALNNVWVPTLPLLITILGWLSIIKGAFILLCPNGAVAVYKKCNTSSVFIIGGIIAFVLGLALMYKGFYVGL